MSQELFSQFLQEAIVSLPQDVKTVLRVVEDPDLEDASRIRAAGAILHVLSGATSIPGMRGLLAYVDDVLILRLVLETVLKESPDAMESHQKEAPELYQPLAENLALARSYLGNGFSTLEQAAQNVGQLTHQGRAAPACIADVDTGTWLYDKVQEALVDQLEFDTDEVQRAVRSAEPVRHQLNQKRA